MKLELTMFNTTAIAVLILFLGSYVKSKIEILRKFCIPVPVVGGLIFTIFTIPRNSRSFVSLFLT